MCLSSPPRISISSSPYEFISDPGFPRPVEVVSPRRLAGRHYGEWARGDRWEVDGGAGIDEDEGQ